MNKARLSRVFLLCIVFTSFKAQVIGRRPFLGISMEAVTEDTKRIMELPEVKGVLINRVIPGSSAEKCISFTKVSLILYE